MKSSGALRSFSAYLRPRSISRSPMHLSQGFKKTPLKAYYQNGRWITVGRIRGTGTGIPCCVAPSGDISCNRPMRLAVSG